jgi:hypothetical protein
MVVRAHLKQGSPEIEKGSTCVLGISVGQIAHENGQLIETLKLLKKSGITKFIFLVADSLQRYTLALTELTLKPDQFKNVADNLGKQWIARNTENISSIIGNDYRIIYWGRILENENFQLYYRDIELKLSDDEDFRNAVESTADSFIKRYQRVVFGILN